LFKEIKFNYAGLGYKTVLESKLMNIDELERHFEKVIVYIGKGIVAKPTKSKYQV